MIDPCPHCGTPMLVFRSLRYKQCTNKHCNQKIPFELKPGQQPLIKHQR